MARKLSPRLLRLAMNLWPPFIGAGIRVRRIAPDFREVVVEMRLGWLNRNYVGTHFGGSLYAMTDPFFMLMVLHNLSSDYLVWDKAAAIEFIAPGRGRVRARFVLQQQDIDAIRQMTAEGDKHLHLFKVDVVDAEGLVVARVEKIVYVRRKKAMVGAPAPIVTAAPAVDRAAAAADRTSEQPAMSRAASASPAGGGRSSWPPSNH